MQQSRVGAKGTKQGMVSGLLPLIPEVVVTCNASTPVKSSEPCNIDVKNPPLESFTIHLDPPPGIDSTSSCLTGVVFQQGQASQTCNMQSSSNITGEITVTAKPIDVFSNPRLPSDFLGVKPLNDIDPKLRESIDKYTKQSTGINTNNIKKSSSSMFGSSRNLK